MRPGPQTIALPASANAVAGSKLRLCSGNNLFAFAERINYLKQHGCHSQHFTALQPGMQYFDVAGTGYLAFATHLNRCMVLGDPVCHESQRRNVIRLFLKANANASFVQVSEPVAKFLHDGYRYYGTQFGQELKVPLHDWTTFGKDRKVIRKALNQAKSQGITVTESAVELPADDVSNKWLQTRKTRQEIAYLVRPAGMSYRENCRYFYAWKNGLPIGFAYFDPAYCNGQVVSYLPNISRGSESFRQGLFYVIMTEAIRKFQSEGIEYLDLGLCPLAMHQQPRAFESRLLRKVFGLTYRHCFHYNCQGVHFTKQRFGGRWERTYFCHKNPMPVVDIWRLLRLSRVF